MKLIHLYSILLLSLTLSLTACTEDEEPEGGSDKNTEKDISEGVGLSSKDITSNIPQDVSDDALIGGQITNMTGFIDQQFNSLVPSQSAIKKASTFTLDAATGGCLTGNESFSEQYTWTDTSFGYTLSFGEDNNNYYWKSIFTSSFDGQSSTFSIDALESKTKFEGCVFYEIDGEEALKISWSENSSGSQIFKYDASGVTVMVLTINPDGSGSAELSGSTYTWDTDGNINFS